MSNRVSAAMPAAEQLQQQPQQQPQKQQQQVQPGSGAAGLAASGSELPARDTVEQQVQTTTAGVGKATPLPALSSIHFATGSQGSDASPSLVGDESFDSAAYAAYQALFNVPAGRHAPALQREQESAAQPQFVPQGPPPDTGAALQATLVAARLVCAHQP